jgi:PAS domain S-box-containing protein
MMLSRFKLWISAPSFPNDDEQTRAAAQVHSIVMAMLLSTAAYTLIWPIIAPTVLDRLVLVLPLYPLLIGLLLIIRRGYVRLAGLVLVTGLWLILLSITITNGGVRAPAFSGNIVVILCAGILLGRRAARNFAAASILLGLMLVYAEQSKWIAPINPTTPAITAWAAQTVFFVVAASLLQLATRSVAEALARARKELIERQHAEDTLTANEKRFRVLIENSYDGLTLLDARGNILYYSPANERISGFTSEEMIGHSGLKLFHPADRKRLLRDFIETAQKPGHITSSIYRILHKDGSFRWVEDVARNLIDDPDVGAIVVNTHDITERAQAEALQDAVYRIAQAADNIESIKDLYPRIHQIISEVMTARNFYIAIYDSGHDKLFFPYFRDEEDSTAMTTGISPARGLTAYVLRTGKSLLCTQAVHDELERRGEIKLLGSSSAIWLGVPLIVAAKTIGVMVVQDYYDSQAYGVREQRVMEFVSTQVATAIYRKQAETALHQSEEQYRYLVEHSPYGVVIHIQGKVAYLNPTAIKLIGAENAAELIGQPVMNFVHPHSRSAVIQRVHEINQGLEAPPLEEIFVRVDGHPIDVEVTAYPLLYQNQAAVQVVFHDITERKRAETQRGALFEIVQTVATTVDLNELLRAIHQSLKKVVYAENCFVTLYDQTDKLFHEVFFVDQFDTALPPHKLGKSATAYVFRTGRSTLLTKKLFQELIEQGEVELLGTLPPSWLGIPLKTPTETIGVLVVQHYENEQAYTERDVEFLQSVGGHIALAIERKYAEDALRQRNRELAVLNQAIHALSQILDPDQVLPAVIDEVRHLLDVQAGAIWLSDPVTGTLICRHAIGPHSESVRGQRLTSGDNLITHIMTDIQSLIINDKQSDPNPIVRSHFAADPDWRSAVLAPLAGRQGAIGVLQVTDARPDRFSLKDRTLIESLADTAAIAIENARLYDSEKKHSTELGRALDQQRELDRLQREFIQNVSHELRTPLALILGHAELVETDTQIELAPETRDSITVIARRARLLSRLVDQILRLLELDNRELKTEPVDLAQLARAEASDFESTLRRAGISLKVEIDDQLPNVEGDPLALRQVISNLIGNALKFTEANGQITLRLYQHDALNVLEVADTGIGIPPDHLARIFDRFYQVDGSITRKYGGVGLGLALVKSIVDLHQGRIEVESQTGIGTTFRVWLPLHIHTDMIDSPI